MNKTLLVSSVLMLGGLSANAFVEPAIYEGAAFHGIAPDGSIVVSEVQGTLIIYDLANNKEYSYESTGEDPYYTCGLGNIVSNNGIVLGSTLTISDAAYWENGEWKQLDTEGAVGYNLSNGITPDGSRICGSLGAAETSIEEDNLMLVPVYWDRNADGTYGKYNILPHPTSDLFGSVPQYVTANYISEDGKTIAGQLVDCTGFFHMPIVYQQDDEGKWSYKLLLEDLFLPEGTVVPEDPGECPAAPQETDYMTADELAAYEAANQAYIESGYDPDLFPEYSNFMSEEGKAAFEAAYAEYQPLFQEWSEKSDAYYEALDAILNAAPQFEFNSVCLTPDGKTYIGTVNIVDESDPSPWGAKYISAPLAINIADGTTKKYEVEGKSLLLTGVPNNDYCFASTGLNTIPMTSYMISLADGTVTSVEDYLAPLSTELKEWMDTNLKHEVETTDWETEETTYETFMFTGMAYASADMSTFAIWEDGGWGNWTPTGMIFDLSQFSGISAPSATPNVSVRFDNDGNLLVEGDVANVDVYDLNGRHLISTNHSGTTPCRFDKGIYIVKAINVDGDSFTYKIVR